MMNIIYIPDVYFNLKHKYYFFSTDYPIFYEFNEDQKLLEDGNTWQIKNLDKNDRQKFINFKISEIQYYKNGNQKIICEKIEEIKNIDKTTFFKDNLININAILVLKKQNSNRFLGQTIQLNEKREQIKRKYFKDIKTKEIFIECNNDNKIENEMKKRGFAKIISAITYVLDNKLICECVQILDIEENDKELAKQIKESLIKRQKYIKANSLLKTELLKMKKLGLIKRFVIDKKNITFITNKKREYLIDRESTKIYEITSNEDRHICLVPIDNEFTFLPKSDLILTKIYYILLNIPYKS